MARRVFYSFHFDNDSWRAGQVRNMGVIEGNNSVSDNNWEKIKKKGDKAIQNWIDGQLEGRSCTIVLIGGKTAGRKWINYEIETSWNNGKGLVGIYIHNLKDSEGKKSLKGRNPFDDFTIDIDTAHKRLSTIVKTHNPPYEKSQKVYDFIKANLEEWVEEAIEIRKGY